MTKHLKDMSIEELQSGYEKGKVTDEEIEQHLLEQIHRAIRNGVDHTIRIGLKSIPVIRITVSNDLSVQNWIRALAEHEYQKLKDNE